MTPSRSLSVCALSPVVAILLLTLPGCSTPKDGLQNLDALHEEVGEPSLAYSETIPRRSWWWRFKRNTLAIVGLGPPSLEATIEVEDPIACALDSLEVIRDGADDLDDIDRWIAVVLVSEWSRRDRARVVRSAGFRTLEVLLAEDDPADGELFRFDTSASPENDILSATEKVRWLVQQDKATVTPQIEQRWEDLRRGAASLLLVRGDRVGVSERLAKLAALSAQQTDRFTIHHEFVAAARVQALRCAFQSCRAGLLEPSEHIQSAAVSTMIAIDPRAAGTEIASAYEAMYAPVVKVEMFRSLLDAGIQAEELAPELRRQLPLELEALDSAVSYWAHRSLTGMLNAPEALSREELRSRWEAVGEPSAPAEGA